MLVWTIEFQRRSCRVMWPVIIMIVRTKNWFRGLVTKRPVILVKNPKFMALL